MITNLLKSVMVLLTFTFSLSTVFVQSPNSISYQSVIRNSSQELVANQSIGMQISSLQNSENGAAVFVETQTTTTSANGLVSLEIGAGIVQSGDFTAIDWAEGPYFIKTETDPTGGANYTITGTSQLLSVPFALHAKEVDPSVPQGTQAGEMQYWNGTEWVIVAAGNEGDIMIFVNNAPIIVGKSTVSTVENPTTDKIWMDKSLGALQVATSSTDTNAFPAKGLTLYVILCIYRRFTDTFLRI